MLITNDRMQTVRRLAIRKGMKPAIVKRPAAIVRKPYVLAEITYCGQKGIGFAKCSPQDVFNEDIGFNIAVSRALEEVKDAKWAK